MAEAEGPSLWVDTSGHAEHPPLTGGLAVDVAIVGGGIVGVTLAYYLTRAGLRVCVLEARRMLGQVTGGTTAKLTSLHGLIYQHLIDTLGEGAARTYGEANQWGIAEAWRLVTDHHIDCALTTCPAFTYSESGAQVHRLQQEVEAAKRLGLPASFTTETELPFPVAGAVRFDDQASFHPLRFLTAVLAEAETAGALVFEHSRVLDVHEADPCRVTTESGHVTAANVVVATNLPILDRGGHFARAFPQRHMVLAAELDGPAPTGMYLSADTPSRSVRGYDGGEGPVLVVSGDSFKTGHADTAAKMDELEAWTHQHFPVRSIRWRWGNQDYYSADRVPFIGRLTALSRHLWTATGFSAWGMSHGLVAARILADGITGRHNAWSDLYKAHRLDLVHGGRKVVEENAHVAVGWVKDRLSKPDARLPAELHPGEHAVATVDGRRTGLYRDDEGVLHAVSNACTHMGCGLQFNTAEKSWDCPCHGSRFAVDGTVLNGPAVKPLSSRSVRS
jgi:glycine/D-amino acid oxidase-like deaminating enzyme/nitrite reductase/ring-hydroxylating ferredoxin subunit